MAFVISSVPDSKKKQLTIARSSLSGTSTNVPVAIHIGSSVGLNDFDLSALLSDLGDNYKKLFVTADGVQCRVEVNPDEWVSNPFVENATTSMSFGSSWSSEKHLRTLIDGSRVTTSGGKLKVAVASYNNGAALASVYIGKPAAAGSKDFDGDQVEVTFAGGSGVTLSGTDSVESDEIVLDVTAGDELLLAFSWVSSSGIALAYQSQAGAASWYGTTGVASDDNMTNTGSYSSTQAFATAINIEGAPAAVIYTKLPSIPHDSDPTILIGWDETQDDNDDYVGLVGEGGSALSVSNSDVSGSANGYGFREVIQASALSKSLPKIKLKLMRTADYSVTAMYIGERDGSTFNFVDGTQVAVTLGGVGAFTVTETARITDEIDFTIDPDKDYIIAFGVSSAVISYLSGGASGCSGAYKSGGSGDASSTTVSGYTSTSNYAGAMRIYDDSVPGFDVWSNGFELVMRPQDPSGTIYDSVNGAVGTVNGDPTLVYQADQFAIDYDGTDDFIEFADTDTLDLTTGYHLDAFFNPQTTANGGLISKLQSSSPNYGWLLNWSFAAGGLYLFANSSSSSWEAHGSTLSVGSWYHGSAKSGRYYIDGALENTNTQTAMPAATTAPVWIGKNYNGSFYNGSINIVFVSSVARSDDWVKITYLSLSDSLITWSNASGSSVRFRILQDLLYYDLLFHYRVENTLRYNILASLRKLQEHIYGLRIRTAQHHTYSDMPVFRVQQRLHYHDMLTLRKAMEHVYHDLTTMRVGQDLEYKVAASLRAMQELEYMLCGQSFRAGLDQVYDIKERDSFRKMVEHLYSVANSGAVLQQPDVSVTIGGRLCTMSVINVATGKDQDVITGQFTTGNQADKLAAKPDDTPVVVSIGPTTYHLIVVTEPRVMRTGPGSDSWVINAVSPAVTMDRVALNQSFDKALASEIATALAAPFGITLSWEVVDWIVPDDTLYANNETPLQVIDKLAKAAGGLKQSAPDGTLRIMPEYPVSVPQWKTASPSWIISEQLDIINSEEIEDERDGYNVYSVSNQDNLQERKWQEEKSIDDATKEIHGFKVPWGSSVQTLEHSGGDWVSIEPMGVVQEAIVETIEIKAGTGQVSKSVYGIVDHHWLEQDLGELSFTEDGMITADTAGYSQVNVSYITRYFKWIVRDPKTEDVQFIREAA